MSTSILPKKQRFTLDHALARIEALESRIAMLEKLVQVLQPPAPPNPTYPSYPIQPPTFDQNNYPWWKGIVWCGSEQINPPVAGSKC